MLYLISKYLKNWDQGEHIFCSQLTSMCEGSGTTAILPNDVDLEARIKGSI